ncbi:hypothetical protein N0V90_006542 [Kalmusia sp. IMI 367209]|nr:hypothetical protein N0V90_006542 [Kalmusia sp. IMI 367209]
MANFRSILVDASFPAELVLEVIERLPYGDGSIISTLARTHPRIRSVLHRYEHSIVQSFIQKELRHAPIDFPCSKHGFAWLERCVKRYDIVDDLMAMLVSEYNVFPVRKHNMALVNTGLLLLFHLQSFESHTAKLTYIKSLPKDPLMAMYLAVHHATLTARYHGEGIIHQRTYGRFMDANTLSLRSDIEHCFAEAALQIGPSFLHESLLSSPAAEPTLLNFYHEHAIRDWFVESVMEGVEGFLPPVTQGPHADSMKKEKNLWTALLEKVAELTECPLGNVRGAIEEDAAPEDHSLAFLNLCGKATLMKGEDLVPRLC